MDPVFYIIIAAGLLIVTMVLLVRHYRSAKVKSDTEQHIKSGAHSVAIQHLQQVLLDTPDDLPALYALAELQLKSGQAYDALQNVKLLLGRNLAGSGVHHVKAVVLAADAAMQAGNEEQAYSFLLTAKGLDPTDTGVNLRLSEFEFKQARYDRAAGFASRVVKLDPHNAKAVLLLGLAWFELKDMEKAIKVLIRAAELDAKSYKALATIAAIYGRRGQFVEAAPYFESALRIASGKNEKAAVYYEMGCAARRALQYPRAEQCFMRCVELKADPQQEAEALLELADIFEHAQRTDKVVWALKAYMEKKPGDESVRRRLDVFGELHRNTKLQQFAMLPGQAFVELCEKLSYAIVSIDTIQDRDIKQGGMVDILASRTTKKKNTVYQLRFLRSNGEISDMLVRDLYAKMRSSRGEHSFFVTNGSFTDSAVSFASSRVINLIDKEKLVKYLGKVK